MEISIFEQLLTFLSEAFIQSSPEATVQPSTREKLFSSENIGGLWSVIAGTLAAFVAVVTLYVKNFFEIKRERNQRKHDLIREAYYGGLEYLAYAFHNSIGQKGEGLAHINATEKYYKLTLAGSAEIVKKFSNIALSYSQITYEVYPLEQEVDLLKRKLLEIDKAVDWHYGNMQRLSHDFDVYSQSGQLSQHYVESVQERRKYLENFLKYKQEENINTFKELKLAEKALDCRRVELVLQLLPEVYDTISCMRSDLERNLKKTEKIELESHFKTMLTTMKNNFDLFIEQNT